MHSDSLETYF